LVIDVDVNKICLERFISNKAVNLRGALKILESDGIKSKEIERIRDEVIKYSDYEEEPTFEYKEEHEEEYEEEHEGEICCRPENILGNPYREWLAK
jgi:hypothetical protein